MPRVKHGTTVHKRHKKILDQAKGYYAARSKLYKTAKQAVIKSRQYAYIHRKQKKRIFRKLWITRINNFVRQHNISYSVFINRLKQLDITINRKILSNLMIQQESVAIDLMKKVINIS
jgi:large subunit ribosomal protein L20